MQWYKYRQRYTYGADEWRYIDVPDGSKRVNEILEQNGLLNARSEKCQGVDVRKVTFPPRDILVDMLKDFQIKLKNLEDKILVYQDQLEAEKKASATSLPKK